jgi:CRP-like cAMP-binding protein
MTPFSSERSERNRLLMKLESIAALEPEDFKAILALPLRVTEFPARHEMVQEGDKPSECCLLLSGWACRHKIIEGGKRQILAFHTPGDIPDLQSLHIRTMDHSLATLSVVRAAFIPHGSLQSLIQSFPRLASAFWRETLIDAAIFREWVVCHGRRTAYQHIAHLFCELRMRIFAVGLMENDSFEFPVTQSDLADASGLSPVHVNRTLMEMRKAKLISFRSSRLTIHDWEGLQRAAHFDPRYLHQDLWKAA